MARASWQRTGTDPQAANVEGANAPAWPILPGVAAAGLVLWKLCPWLRQGSLPRAGLLILAISLLFTAAMISGFVARILSAKISPDSLRPSFPVVQAACLTSLWIPAWVLFAQTWSLFAQTWSLFAQTWSLLMMVAGCLCLASLGIFLKRYTAAPVAPSPSHSERLLGAPLETTPISRALLPSLTLALLAEAAVALTIARRYPAASLVFGACAAAIAWRATSPRPLPSKPRPALVATGAFLFTVIALLPYLKVSPLHGGLIPLLQHNNATRREDGPPKEPANASDGYTGIILLSPSEERKMIALPVKHEIAIFSHKFIEPMEIPFDGAYWYFKAPDKAPRPTARVVRGSSIKTTVRSSDGYPLLMEAHQKLTDPIDLGCCSAIQLVVQNGDHREGAIALELWVKRRSVSPPSSHYLGTAVIPSSTQSGSAPQEEKLLFPIPSAMDGTQFDEITVIMHAAPARARIGAQVAIRRFVLEP